MNLLTDVAHDEEESENYFTEAGSGQEGPEHDTSASDDESHPSLRSGQCALPVHRGVPSTMINNEPHHFHDYNTRGYSGEIHRSAWYRFDSVVLLALISPAGNWLTGGDHIKNLLFLALLVYYLHQVIEVPWELYQKVLHRNQLPGLPPLNPEDRYRKLAISELRKVEVLCLAFTAVSPFLGASLLRYATHFILEPGTMSWFSTSLFVMATGIRPWSHLIERLNQRTGDLQDFIHHSPSSNHAPLRDLHKDICVLSDRINKLERSCNGMKHRFKENSKEILDHVDDVLDSVKCSLRKHQKRWDEQDERLRLVNKSVVAPWTIFLKRTFSPLQWFGERFNLEPWKPHVLSPNIVAVPVQLEMIRREGYNAITFPDKFIQIFIRLSHFLGFIMFLPFHLAIRILFQR
ncbi:hypothetical protein Ac2012v2_006239 [Leucoagaricus gongylophorus]